MKVLCIKIRLDCMAQVALLSLGGEVYNRFMFQWGTYGMVRYANSIYTDNRDCAPALFAVLSISANYVRKPRIGYHSLNPDPILPGQVARLFIQQKIKNSYQSQRRS